MEIFAHRFAGGFEEGPISTRKVGREAEYPIVGEDGAAFDISALWGDLDRPGHTRIFAPDGMQVGLDGLQYSYASEVGRGTIEVITGPRHDLVQLAGDHEAAVEYLVKAAARNGATVLGMGTQPLTPPSPELMTPKPRYGILLDVIGDPWLSFTATASDQTHVDMARSEIGWMTNLGNLLAPVFIALCGNSGVVAGADAGVCCWREQGMGTIGAVDGRHGMPLHPIEDVADHVNRLCALPHLLHKRDGVAEPGEGSFADFIAAEGGIDSDEAFASFLVHEHYVWHSARPRSGHGTLEFRAACQGPWQDHMAVSALALGIVSGGAEIGRYVETTLGNDAWPLMRRWHAEVIEHGLAASEPALGLIQGVLDRARGALRGRGRSEAAYLDPLYRRLERGENPAQTSRRIHAADGLPGLIAHVGIPAPVE